MGRFGGFVAKYMGDGVLVYFGFPRAHEDDAERAVRAGIDMIAAVGRLGTSAGTLEVRIGIATGLVVVGDLIGEGASREQAVVGETPNLAARLQALAQAGGIVLPPATRQLLGNRFTLRNLGRHAVKGIADPVAAPAVGQHTESVLRELLGYDDRRMASLAEAGAFGPNAPRGSES